MICNRLKTAFVFIAAMIMSSGLMAQEKSIPALPDDPSIKISILPCGMKMYFAPNKASKSMLSLALVQQVDSTVCDSAKVVAARSSFSESGFHRRPIEDFLSHNGMIPGREGYVSYSSGVVFSYDSLSLSRGEKVLDSLLLSIFRIAAASSMNGMPSSAQALIVAGDFDYEKLCTKTALLSMVCPLVEGNPSPAKYKWNSDYDGGIEVVDGVLTKISIQWRDARVPEQYLKTVLPVITQKLGEEFGWVLRSRLNSIFQLRGIRTRLSYAYKGSSPTGSDVVSTLTVFCERENSAEVEQILREELDRLCMYGVSTDEYVNCRDANRFAVLRESTVSGRGNSELMQRCIYNFFSGASLATMKERLKFAYRQMPDSLATRLFNKYVSKRLEGSCERDSSLAPAPVVIPRDTVLKLLSAYVPAQALKLPKDKAEYISTGLKWTYSNGINVIYKKLPGEDMVSYCYCVKGTEKMADRKTLETIDGLSGDALYKFMSSVGIEMKMEISPLSVRFSGTAPAESFDILVNILSAISMQKDNKGVFAPDRFKLFACSGSLTNEQVKKTMAKYAESLGGGVSWSGLYDTKEAISDKKGSGVLPSNGIAVEFPYNLSSTNYALVKLARLVLRDALAAQFSGKCTVCRVRGGFESFPIERYTMRISAISTSPDGFAAGDTTISASDARLAIRACLSSLSAEELSKERLAVYKKLAINAFESQKQSTDFYVSAVVNRYVFQKDVYTNFVSDVNKTSAADLKNFFSAALERER